MGTKNHGSAKRTRDYPARATGAKNAGAARTKTALRGESGDPDETRRKRIARAAYQRAEQRGFAGGSELQDWLDAEAEVDGMTAG